MPTTITVLAAGGQTVGEVARNARDRFTGQTSGIQKLGTIQLSTGAGRQDLFYDPTADIIYAVAIA